MGHYRKEQYKCHTKYAAVNLEFTTYFVLFYLSMASWNGMEVGRSRFSIKTSCLGKAIKKSIQYFIGNGKPRRERTFAKVFLNHYRLITLMFNPILIVRLSSSSSSGSVWRLFWYYLISGNDNEIFIPIFYPCGSSSYFIFCWPSTFSSLTF